MNDVDCSPFLIHNLVRDCGSHAHEACSNGEAVVLECRSMLESLVGVGR
jgi:hypothetical protein